MLLPVENEDLESIVTSCRSAHTVQCSREWCLTCFCAAAGSSLFQCSSNDLIYNKLHAEAFPEVVSSASAGDEINNHTTGKSTAAVIIENQATTPAEIQTLLARIALVSEEGGDMLGVVAEIQEWLLSLPDTDEVGSWVNLCVTLSKIYKDTIGEARGISDELRRNQKILLDKLEESKKALTDLQQTSDRNERILVDQLHDEQNIFASQREAWDDHEMILLNQLEEEIDLQQTLHLNESALVSKLEEARKALIDLQQTSSRNERTLGEKLEETHSLLTNLQEKVNKNTPDIEEMHTLLARIESAGVEDVEDVILGTEEWLDRQSDPDHGVSLKSLCTALVELCRRKANDSRDNEQRLLITLQEVRQMAEALRTDQEKIMPASEDIQRLLTRISLVSGGNEDTLLEEEELRTIGEICDWLAVRPDVAVKNSVSRLGFALSQLCRAKTSKTWALRKSLQDSLGSKERLEKQLNDRLHKNRETQAKLTSCRNESQETITALKQELHQGKLAFDELTKQLNEEFQRSRANEANFTYRLNEAYAANSNLQFQLYQARPPVNIPPNFQPPYEPTRTDVEYIRALGRNYRC